MTDSDIEIGRRLAIVRKLAGMSQNELARVFGTSHTTLRRYERGKVTIPVQFVLAVYKQVERVRPGEISLEWILVGDRSPLVLGRVAAEQPREAQSGAADALLAEQLLQAAESQHKTACESRRPFVLLKPQLFIDGDAWCALYGSNLQDGVAGFGDTPEEAALAFDLAWRAGKPAKSRVRRLHAS